MRHCATFEGQLFLLCSTLLPFFGIPGFEGNLDPVGPPKNGDEVQEEKKPRSSKVAYGPLVHRCEVSAFKS